MPNCAIVIPIYKENLNWNEEISLLQCKKILNNYDLIFVYPKDLLLNNYKTIVPNARFIPLPKHHFKNISAYSKMMMRPFFYKIFRSYKYILIHQLDVFVFKDQLNEWIDCNYDYVGAPWINADWINKLKGKISFIEKIMYPVGNGGFSLRKVKTFYYSSIFLFPIYLLWNKKWNEDLYWSIVGKLFIPFYKVPKTNIALQFAFEENPEKCYILNKEQIPFGCHAWEKYNPEFWSKHIDQHGFDVSKHIDSKTYS